MKYGSVCSGIEAATVAWHPLGWEPQWFSEIEKYPCDVLSHYYPTVPNLGSMIGLERNAIFNESIINLLVGGTPCQGFSEAGLRGGLADERSNLSLEFCRILTAKQPQWFLWENVPGVFSSFSDPAGDDHEVGDRWTETSDFATLIEAFQECGYSCAWRVFDAQYFGVPQRRRRVFVVGYLGNDWRPPFAVLSDPESMRGNTPPMRLARQAIAGTLTSRSKGGGFPGTDEFANGYIQPVSSPLTASSGRTRGAGIEPGQLVAESLTTRPYSDRGDAQNLVLGFDMQTVGSPTNRTEYSDSSCTMHTKGTQAVVMATGQPNAEITHDVCSTLNCNHEQPIVFPAVRRLTPMECERLQGFPDGYTLIPGASDTVRYKALGNSMAVSVMHYIGSRIAKVDKLLKTIS